MKGVLGMGHLSLKTLTAEGFDGGFLYWENLGYERKALGMGISLHGGSVRQILQFVFLRQKQTKLLHQMFLYKNTQH
jgi:hypothetical protein